MKELEIAERLIKDVGLTPQELKGYLSFKEEKGVLKLVQRQHIEKTTWKAILQVVRDFGGDFQYVGKHGEFRVPIKYQPPPEKKELLSKAASPGQVSPPRVEPVAGAAETPPPRGDSVAPLGVGGVDYDLKESVDKIGHLYPVLLDANGNIIDGFHRKEADPNWPTKTLEHIKDAVQLNIARIIANACRRDVPAEEKTKWLQELINYTKWTPKQLSDNIPFGYSWVMKYLPDEFKDKEKAKVGRIGGIESGASRREAKELNHMVECECCGLGTYFPTHIDGHFYCRNCVETGRYREKKPKRRKEKVPEEQPKVEVKTYRKPQETAETRAARMHPPVSKMEEKVLEALSGIPIAYEQEFCVQKTKPDIFFPDHNLAVYLDGPQHFKREDQDSNMRERLTKFYDVEVLGIPYSGRYTKAECARIVGEIKQRLKET